ncbi:Hopanoid-associated sugar epimerase [Parasponia andersonii]|uniref:Hopanoid-associated sugar epimerase n=1 Tax=Parasponia andersonii TaxID=3476 RepID=A0A2P5AZ40_PARAD|nr:Hopanoid-associated sugar epimerase [Parasponia andersonii]
MDEKSRVLVVGGTGYIGRRIVKASLAEGHPTFVLRRPEIGLDIEKVQMLLWFKKQGAHLVEGSFSDFQSLVDAVKQVDVVICTMSGVHFRSHNILMQLKLVAAIKEAGNVKPPDNILSQRQLVEKWEELLEKKLEKITISEQDFLAPMKDLDYAEQVGVGHFYHIFYEGCLTNFEIGEEASKLYPEVKYTRVEEYLKMYL